MKEKNIANEVKLETLKTLGFIFRIPGGSSRTGDHASYGLIVEYQNGIAYLLVVPYNPSIRIDRKYEEDFEEEPKGNLELKVSEQTGVLVRRYHHIGNQEAKNNRLEVKAEKHIKHVFFVETFDDSNIRQDPTKDKRIDPPLWLPEDFWHYICPQHQWMLGLLEKELGPKLHEHS